jgi:hypothetical protein
MILQRARRRAKNGLASRGCTLICFATGSPIARQIKAHPGEIQLLLLGHTSTAMARRYTGSAAKRQGARLMPHYYSPI